MKKLLNEREKKQTSYFPFTIKHTEQYLLRNVLLVSFSISVCSTIQNIHNSKWVCLHTQQYFDHFVNNTLQHLNVYLAMKCLREPQFHEIMWSVLDVLVNFRHQLHLGLFLCVMPKKKKKPDGQNCAKKKKKA